MNIFLGGFSSNNGGGVISTYENLPTPGPTIQGASVHVQNLDSQDTPVTVSAEVESLYGDSFLMGGNSQPVVYGTGGTTFDFSEIVLYPSDGSEDQIACCSRINFSVNGNSVGVVDVYRSVHHTDTAFDL